MITRAQWHNCVISALNLQFCLLLLFMFPSVPCLLQKRGWYLGHTEDALGSWQSWIPTLIPATSTWAWVTSCIMSVAGCYGNCSATLGLLAHPVCACTTSSALQGLAGRDFYEFWFPTLTHTHTCTHTWNSILGLDPKLCFAPSEESHSFQWSLDQTVPCQWSEWLHYNYLGIKILLGTSRNDIILAWHLLPKKNET